MGRKKVMVFIDWFLPGFEAGGPIQSVFNLCKTLSNKVDFYIVTSDRDLNAQDAYSSIEFNKWTTYDEMNVIYLSSDHQKYSFVKCLIKETDAETVYLNSFFSIKFALFPLISAVRLDKKIVLAPRGMLGAGALKIKGFKKQVFILLFKLFGFHKKVLWQATAETEMQDLFSVFGKGVDCRIATNLGKPSSTYRIKENKDTGSLNVFFLSRVSKKKNLLFALKILSRLKPDLKFFFDIIGPIEDKKYWEECEQIIADLPSNITVSYLGSFPNHELPDLLHKQHLMFLPTFNENFGHVIMESWQNGCPVLISDQTPWLELENKKIGWDISLVEELKFINALEYCAMLDHESFNNWSKSSFEYALDFYLNSGKIDESKKLFNIT